MFGVFGVGDGETKADIFLVGRRGPEIGQDCIQFGEDLNRRLVL